MSSPTFSPPLTAACTVEERYPDLAARADQDPGERWLRLVAAGYAARAAEEMLHDLAPVVTLAPDPAHGITARSDDYPRWWKGAACREPFSAEGVLRVEGGPRGVRSDRKTCPECRRKQRGLPVRRR